MNLRQFVLLPLMILGIILGPNALHAQIPVLNSRPGAEYTMYLNFGGFDFTGTWGPDPSNFMPGSTPAYTIDGSASFSATEIANMKEIWSRVSEKYSILNINVTTVDPAPSGSTDAQRQMYYDQTPQLMQTVIGGSGSWIPGAGGVSYIDVAQYYVGSFPSPYNGVHTNFVFAAQNPTFLQFIAEASAHEDGHALSLQHQSRYSGATKIAEYDSGSGTGSGSFAPIMGVSYYAERGTWRIGAGPSDSSPTAQNDLAYLLSNNNMTGDGAGGFMNSGIGHTTATATALPLTGTTINSTLAAGLITPNSSTPLAIGEANYTNDLFSILVTSPSALLNVNLNSGRSTITPGVADPGATLNATLRLLDSTGATLLTSNSGVLTESLATTLSTGQYYLKISSAGGSTNNGYSYFDVGSYFLTGSVVAVPEPGLTALAGLMLVATVAAWRRRSKQRQGVPALSGA